MPVPGAQQLSPGGDFACHPDVAGLLVGNSALEYQVNVGVVRRENGDDGVTAYDKRHCTGIHLFLMNFSGQHGVVHHSVQHVGHSLARAACRDVDFHVRIPHLEIIGPLHRQRVQRECTGH